MFIDKVDHFTLYETEAERLEMIHKASIRTAVSNFYATFNSQLFGVPFIVIPNMINNDFAAIPLPRFPKDKEKFYFFSIGELARRKRYDILIDAFTRAFKNNIEVHLNLAGSGPLAEELRKQVVSLGMEDQIHLLGFQEKEGVIKLMDTTHVLVISSEKESFSMAAAESLFRGNPVLSTRCKGPEDFITEHNGMTCELNNVEDMQQKLKEIYVAYSSFNNYQIAEDARNLFSEKVIVQKLEELYHQVTSSQPA
jgi:glycosyltransferase involved in cell wall biosynthesis